MKSEVGQKTEEEDNKDNHTRQECRSMNMRERGNKAGYTATSCGRVGTGGNAHFPTFRLAHTDGRTDGQTDGQSLLGSYRAACPQLKRTIRFGLKIVQTNGQTGIVIDRRINRNVTD